MNSKQPCLCNSQKNFGSCCQPLLQDKARAKTPLALMRSRFSAFKLGGHGDYLLKTWLPNQRNGVLAAELSVKSAHWQRLEILSKSQKGDQAHVEFIATYLDDDNQERAHREFSLFRRIDGVWYYDKAKG